MSGHVDIVEWTRDWTDSTYGAQIGTGVKNVIKIRYWWGLIKMTGLHRKCNREKCDRCANNCVVTPRKIWSTDYQWASNSSIVAKGLKVQCS